MAAALVASALAPAVARGDDLPPPVLEAGEVPEEAAVVAEPTVLAPALALAPPSSVPRDPDAGVLLCSLVPRRSLHAVAVGAGYDARAAAIADSGGSRVELGVTARVDVALDFDLGDCAGGQTVAASLAVTPRWDPSLGRGLDVIAAVGANPTPTYDDRANWAMAPGSWDLEVRGRLAARPGRFAAAELDRAAFDAYALAGAVRMVRIETGDCARVGDGAYSQRPCDRDVAAREAYTFDVFPIGGAVERIDQGTRRLERRWDGAMLRMIGRTTKVPFEFQLDFPRLELREVQVGEQVAAVDVIWPLYVALRNPTTGTLYRIGYGSVMADDPEAGPEEVEAPALFAIGAGYGELTGSGAMIGLERDATFDMRLRPAIELRATTEAWAHVGPWTLTGRGVLAHTAPMAPDGTLGAGTVTGGVELAAARRLWGIDARLDLTGGKSYYAELDGGAPIAAWSGQVALTLSRSGAAGTTAPGMVYAR
jgi:hypothetical protein